MSDFLFSTPNANLVAELEINPQLAGVAFLDLVTRDFHVTEVTVTNQTATDATFTIQDRQGTPLPLFFQVTIAANSTFGLSFRGRWMPGGVSVKASVVNTVIIGMRGY